MIQDVGPFYRMKTDSDEIVSKTLLNNLSGQGFSVSCSAGFEFSLQWGPSEIDTKLRELMPRAFGLIDEYIPDEDTYEPLSDVFPTQLKWLLCEKDHRRVMPVQQLPFPTVEDLACHIDTHQKVRFPQNTLFLGKLYALISLVDF